MVPSALHTDCTAGLYAPPLRRQAHGSVRKSAQSAQPLPPAESCRSTHAAHCTAERFEELPSHKTASDPSAKLKMMAPTMMALCILLGFEQ